MTVTSRVSDPAGAHDSTVIRSSLAEPQRFGEIFDAHFTAIHRYVAARIGAGPAEDVVAETFLAAFRKRGRYDESKASVRTWLYGIATNLAGKHRRSEMRALRALGRSAPEGTAEGPEESVTVRVSAEGLRPGLAAAIADLSRGDRDVLLLVALAGLSHQEIAAALDIPAGTVGSRLNRARRKLREALGGTNPMLDVKDHSNG